MITKDFFHSSIAAELINYISLKQALGRSFQTASIVLFYLDRFLCELGAAPADLTAETFRQWCQTMESVSSTTRLARMRIVRNFCLYRRRTAPTCFVPDPTQFPKASARAGPYIFSDIEVARLLHYSDSIPVLVRSPLRAATTRLAIVLLYTTGIRRGELLRLTSADYSPKEQTLAIHSSKFYKSRILPLPNDVAMELEAFLKKHKSVRPRLPDDAPLLLNPRCGGQAYSGTQLRETLHMLFNLAGIKKTDGRLPRIHDFRFSFAVNALVRWYRSGFNVQAKLPLLAAYMGHVSVLSTYYYMRWIEPLASVASSLFAARYGALIQEPEGGVP
jgi:integrase/recombinase XerD